MEMTVLFIPVFHSGLRQNPRLTANLEMFKLTISIIVGHQASYTRNERWRPHGRSHCDHETALLHQKIVRNGRKFNAYWAEGAFADNFGELQ